MLQSILISPNEKINAELAAALKGSGQIEVVRVLTAYPTVDEFLRTIRVRKPHVVFLCVDDLAKAEELAFQVDDFFPGLPIIAVGSQLEIDVLPKLMRTGIREYLTSPITYARLAEVIDTTQRYLKRHVSPAFQLGGLYTFLPAKPGVGCSTITVSTSCALADNLGARTLLLDCDLGAGAIKFLLSLGNSASVVDAIEHAGSLDEDLWTQLVGRWDKLDVLHAGELIPPPHVDLDSLHSVLNIARSQYEVICADLASSLDDFSIDLMRESRRIFVVCTPEVVPLHLAAQRVRSLEKLGLDDRISLLLNRKSSRNQTLSDAEVVRTVGLPLAFTFSNDYAGVEKAIINGKPVGRDSELGHSILNLARSITPQLEPKESTKRRRFLEFFHVPRIEESGEVWHD
jgi:pilus assembly protein CpaE